MKAWAFPVSIGLAIFVTLLALTFTRSAQLAFLAQASIPAQLDVVVSSTKTADRAAPLQMALEDDVPETVCVPLPDGGNVTTVDLRVSSRTAEPFALHLYYVLLKRPGFKPVPIDWTSVTPMHGVSTGALSAIRTLASQQGDMALRLSLPKVYPAVDWTVIVEYACLAASIAVALFLIIRRWKRTRRSIADTGAILALVFIAGLTARQALLAPFNDAPDEVDHFLSAEFFKNHSDTPLPETQSGIYTFSSIWAYSRVYTPSPDYRWSGAFSNAFGGRIPAYRAVRLLGPFLLIVLAGLLLYRPGHALILAPLLITPQAWYVFSYVNDDRLPLFLAFCIVFLTEAGRPLARKGAWQAGAWTVSIGLLLGLLLLSKSHYLLFAALYVPALFLSVYRQAPSSEPDKRPWRSLRYPVIVLVVALATAGLRWGWIQINADRTPLTSAASAAVEQARCNRAAMFEAGRSGQDKFGSFRAMLGPWIEWTAKSFFGVYGYMNRWAAPWRYNVTLLIAALSGVYLIGAVAWRRHLAALLWLTLPLALLGGLIVAAAYFYAYRYDYQPQGRYLFPFLPLLGFALARFKAYGVTLWPLAIPAALLFGLGVWSFVAVAGIGL